MPVDAVCGADTGTPPAAVRIDGQVVALSAPDGPVSTPDAPFTALYALRLAEQAPTFRRPEYWYSAALDGQLAPAVAIFGSMPSGVEALTPGAVVTCLPTDAE